MTVGGTQPRKYGQFHIQYLGVDLRKDHKANDEI